MMDADATNRTLRMIPYGLYVLTADDGKGTVGAATVNWVTQPDAAILAINDLGNNVFYGG